MKIIEMLVTKVVGEWFGFQSNYSALRHDIDDSYKPACICVKIGVMVVCTSGSLVVVELWKKDYHLHYGKIVKFSPLSCKWLNVWSVWESFHSSTTTRDSWVLAAIKAPFQWISHCSWLPNFIEPQCTFLGLDIHESHTAWMSLT